MNPFRPKARGIVRDPVVYDGTVNMTVNGRETTVYLKSHDDYGGKCSYCGAEGRAWSTHGFKVVEIVSDYIEQDLSSLSSKRLSRRVVRALESAFTKASCTNSSCHNKYSEHVEKHLESLGMTWFTA